MKLKKLKKVIPEIQLDILQNKMKIESIKHRKDLYDIIKSRLTKRFGPIRIFWETELEEFVLIPKKLGNKQPTPNDQLIITHQLLVNPKSRNIFNLIRIFNYYCMIIDTENIAKYIDPNISKETMLSVITSDRVDPWSMRSKDIHEIKESKIAIIYDSWDGSR